MKDITLLFMPQCMPYDPYPSLPYLTGYMRQREIKVEQCDANLEFYHYILSETQQKKAFKKARKRFDALNSMENLSMNELAEMKKLIKPVLFAEVIIDRIPSAIEVMQNRQMFYDPIKYLWANENIHAALALYSSMFFPEMVDFSSYHFYDEKITTIKDIIKLVESDRISIFHEYLTNKLLPKFKKDKPAVIGFSMFDISQFYVSLLFIKILRKQLDYKPVILFGGILMSFYKDKFQDNPQIFDYIDDVLIYEGEEPLYQFMQYIDGKRSVNDVENLIYRNNQGKVIMNPIGKFDINKIAVPDYVGLPIQQYFSPESVMSIISSKGCHWAKCTFCTQHLISGKDVYVERDIENVINDIKRLQSKYGTKFFWLNDTSVDANRLDEIAQRIIEENIEVSWRCESRFDKELSEEIIKKLAKSGCKKIGFGMETASTRMLRHIKKGITLENVKRILKTCYENNIAPQVYYIIGLPTETNKDIQMTLDFIEENRKYMGTFGFSALFLEEGSDLQLYPEKNGVYNLSLANELRRAYDFKNTEVDSQTAHNIVKNVVAHYAKEIEEKPFWGDEVESHHLFYLDYFKDVSLNCSKIQKKQYSIIQEDILSLNCEIVDINYSIEAIEKGEPTPSCKTKLMLIRESFKIFQVEERIITILEKFKNPNSVANGINEVCVECDLMPQNIESIILKLLNLGALKMHNIKERGKT